MPKKQQPPVELEVTSVFLGDPGNRNLVRALELLLRSDEAGVLPDEVKKEED